MISQKENAATIAAALRRSTVDQNLTVTPE